MSTSAFATQMNFKLAHNILRIKNPDDFVQFYLDNFGMQNILIHNTSYSVNLLGYSTNYDENFNKASNTLASPTFLELHHTDALTNISMVNSGRVNVYWKIGLTLHDVDYARAILQSKGIEISDPSQFEDIGYVCHLTDPNGFIIELLQHHFQATFVKKHLPEEKFPLGYPCCLGQITIQANDIDKTQKFYGDVLGMKLLSIQDVPRYSFTLYFYAWTDENPPESDVISMREWLWKRPYTTIEIRYFHGTKQIPRFKDLQKDEIGFQGIRIMCDDLNLFKDKMTEENISFNESNGIFGREIIIRDPDNIPIYVTTKFEYHALRTNSHYNPDTDNVS